MTGTKWQSFDGYLLSMAQDKGAQVIQARISDVQRSDNQLLIQARAQPAQMYDLLAVTTGVNSAALKLFENDEFDYRPQDHRTAIREYYLGADVIENYLSFVACFLVGHTS
jgi:hypothetical protein